MGIGVAYVSSLMGTFRIVLTPEFCYHENALNKKVSGFSRFPGIRFSSPHILL
jgi:hypothetical protein